MRRIRGCWGATDSRGNSFAAEAQSTQRKNESEFPDRRARGVNTFKTHGIKHHFCPQCGCAPFGVGADKSGAAMAAVNVRCLEGVDLATVKRRPFDGRKL
jgi:hypothetical protein